MGGHAGAPISAALQLEPAVTLAQVKEALAKWLQAMHGVALEPAEHEDLVVEWRLVEGPDFACQVAISDSGAQARRTITALSDDIGAVAIIEEAPLTAVDTPHAVVDLTTSIRLLLDALLPLTPRIITLARGELNPLCTIDPAELLSALQEEMAPGLLVAVTPDEKTGPSSTQRALLDGLAGLAILGLAPAGTGLLNDLCTSSRPRSGSIVSITRTLTGLDAQVIASTSLRTKLESARRLVIRRQLSAPIPFSLERRRSAAMRRLLAGSPGLDLPTAMELLDEESQRANKLDNRVKHLEAQLEWAFEEQDAALSDLDEALSRLRYLERAFRERGEVPTVERGFDDDWRPESSADALEAARELLPFLVISSTEDTCYPLDEHQKRSIWAKKIWLALLALNDYCCAKADGRFSGDIAMYRANPPDQAIPLLADYAPMESESTTNSTSLRALRTFKVPVTVSPTGKAYMEQHLKIDKGGQLAPRIHIYDDSGGASQRIHVGYIGPHLPTSSGF